VFPIRLEYFINIIIFKKSKSIKHYFLYFFRQKAALFNILLHVRSRSAEQHSLLAPPLVEQKSCAPVGGLEYLVFNKSRSIIDVTTFKP